MDFQTKSWWFRYSKPIRITKDGGTVNRKQQKTVNVSINKIDPGSDVWENLKTLKKL